MNNRSTTINNQFYKIKMCRNWSSGYSTTGNNRRVPTLSEEAKLFGVGMAAAPEDGRTSRRWTDTPLTRITPSSQRPLRALGDTLLSRGHSGAFSVRLMQLHYVHLVIARGVSGST